MIKNEYKEIFLAFVAEDLDQDGVLNFDQFDNSLLESPEMQKYLISQSDLPGIFKKIS